MDDIHDFRVEIKKWKAFLGLLGTDVAGTAVPAISKKLRKTYKVLGKIRLCQLQQAFIEKQIQENGIPNPVIYMNRIGRQMDGYKKKATGLSGHPKNPGREKRSFRKGAPENLSLTAVQSFLDKKMKAIRNLLKKTIPDEETMHLIRKHLKDIQYNISWMPKGAFVNPPGERDPDTTLKNLASLLGDYHDLRIALRLLQEALNEKKLPPEESKTLENIRGKWMSEKANIGQQAYQACCAFMAANTRSPESGTIPLLSTDPTVS